VVPRVPGFAVPWFTSRKAGARSLARPGDDAVMINSSHAPEFLIPDCVLEDRLNRLKDQDPRNLSIRLRKMAS
jgi:hypothetical protein